MIATVGLTCRPRIAGGGSNSTPTRDEERGRGNRALAGWNHKVALELRGGIAANPDAVPQRGVLPEKLSVVTAPAHQPSLHQPPKEAAYGKERGVDDARSGRHHNPVLVPGVNIHLIPRVGAQVNCGAQGGLEKRR